MAIVKKISELTPKGSNLGTTDLLIVGVDNGTDYDLKSVTGAQLLGTVVSQTITAGVTAKAPSENALFDKLKEYDSLSSSQNTSTAIRFDKKFIHADTDISGKFIGLTGNITVSTGVGIGTLNVNTQSLLIHNHISIPTFSSEFIKAQDSLDYKINVDNYVICTLINQNPFKVSYRIVRDSNDLRLITTAESTILSNTSGTNTGDQTFLNARVQSVTSSATVTPISTNDLVIITAQAVGLTLANPTGTFTDGQALMIRIKDNATARSIAFDTNYRAIGVTLPTTTVISKTLYLGIIYNSTDSKWDVIGSNIQA